MKKQISSLCRSTAAGIVLPLLTLSTAHGSLVTWSSSVNGGTTGADWNNQNSWLGGSVPLVSDTVVINNTNSDYLITPLSNVNVGSGTMSNSASHTTTLNINSGITFASTSITNTVFTVGAYSTVNISGTMSYSAHAAAAYMVNGGVINVNNGGVLTSTNSSYTTIQGAYGSPGGVIVNQGGKYIDSGYQTRVGGGGGISSYLTINGGMASFNQLAVQCPTSNTATLNVNSGTLSVGTFSTTTATLNISGGITTIGGLTNLGNASGATATMTQTGGTWNQTGNNYVIGGQNTSTAIYNISGGAFTGNAYTIQVGALAQSSGTAQLNISGGSLSATKLDVQYGTATILGGTTTLINLNVASTGSAAMSFTKGVLNISGTTTYGAPSAFNVGDGTNVATLNLTSGTHTFTNGLSVKSGATLANNANVIANLDVAGLMNGGGFVSGTTTASGTIAGSVTFNNDVAVNNTGTVTGGTFNANVINNGSITSALTIQSGKTLSGNGSVSGLTTTSGTIAGSLTFANNVTVNNTGTVTGGTFNANVTNNGSITSALAVQSGKTLNGSGSVAGAVVNSGTIAGSLTFNNDVTINSGATASAAAFNGNIVNSGTITSAVNVAAQKTLSGNNGVVTNSVTVSGTTSPGIGGSTGKLKLDLTYNSGATANFNVSSTSTTSGIKAQNSNLYYSQIEVSGSNGGQNLNLGGTLTNGTSNSGVTLALSMSSEDFATLVSNATNNYVGGGANTALDNFFVFKLDTGVVNGEFQTLSLDIGGTIYTGTIYYSGANDRFNGVTGVGDVYVNVSGTTQEFAISYFGDSAHNSTIGGNDIVITAVPEPGAWAMLLGGFGMLVGMQKLRQRKAGLK